MEKPCIASSSKAMVYRHRRAVCVNVYECVLAPKSCVLTDGGGARKHPAAEFLRDGRGHCR